MKENQVKLSIGRTAIATLVATGVLIGGTATVASAAPVKTTGKTVTVAHKPVDKTQGKCGKGGSDVNRKQCAATDGKGGSAIDRKLSVSEATAKQVVKISGEKEREKERNQGR